MTMLILKIINIFLIGDKYFPNINKMLFLVMRIFLKVFLFIWIYFVRVK